MGGLSCHMSRQKSVSVCGSGPVRVCIVCEDSGTCEAVCVCDAGHVIYLVAYMHSTIYDAHMNVCELCLTCKQVHFVSTGH